MDITLNSPQTFPAGTTVKAYPATNWQAGQPKEGAPKGAAAGEAVVAANGDIALTGLTEGLSYYAVAEVGGIYRYVQFLPEEPKSAEQEVGAAGEAGKVLAADDAFNPDGTLKDANLPVSVVSSSRYDAKAEEWEPRPSANVVVFSSADKEAATPGDIQAGDLIVRATE